MHKLIIQIPCFNEADTLPQVIEDLPTELPGVEKIEYLVIDDGSTDRTAEVAREHGVHHVISLGTNRGLARAFSRGLDEALALGATVIVNTDADNQYDASCIPDLIAPVISGEADMVVGARPVTEIEHFSTTKKFLQNAGSYAVRTLSGTEVADAPSGMRAFTRNMAMRLFIHNNYTYTLESLIQAGQSGYKVVSVPIRVNGETRPSRLVKSNFSYVIRSIETILRAYAIYKPLRIFGVFAGIMFMIAAIIGTRFLVRYFTDTGEGMIQSLLVVVICSIVGFIFIGLGILCDLNSANRRLLEDLRYQIRKNELDD